MDKVQAILQDSFGKVMEVLTSSVPYLLGLTSNLVSILVTAVLSLVFSIYMLAGKDTLLGQCRRVLRAYLPKELYEGILDVTALTAGTTRGGPPSPPVAPATPPQQRHPAT